MPLSIIFQIIASFAMLSRCLILFSVEYTSAIAKDPRVACALYSSIYDYLIFIPFFSSASFLLIFYNLRSYRPGLYYDLNHDKITTICYSSIPIISFISLSLQFFFCQQPLCREALFNTYVKYVKIYQNATTLAPLENDKNKDNCFLNISETIGILSLLLFIFSQITKLYRIISHIANLLQKSAVTLRNYWGSRRNYIIRLSRRSKVLPAMNPKLGRNLKKEKDGQDADLSEDHCYIESLCKDRQSNSIEKSAPSIGQEVISENKLADQDIELEVQGLKSIIIDGSPNKVNIQSSVGDLLIVEVVMHAVERDSSVDSINTFIEHGSPVDSVNKIIDVGHESPVDSVNKIIDAEHDSSIDSVKKIKVAEQHSSADAVNEIVIAEQDLSLESVNAFADTEPDSLVDSVNKIMVVAEQDPLVDSVNTIANVKQDSSVDSVNETFVAEQDSPTDSLNMIVVAEQELSVDYVNKIVVAEQVSLINEANKAFYEQGLSSLPTKLVANTQCSTQNVKANWQSYQLEIPIEMTLAEKLQFQENNRQEEEHAIPVIPIQARLFSKPDETSQRKLSLETIMLGIAIFITTSALIILSWSSESFLRTILISTSHIFIYYFPWIVILQNEVLFGKLELSMNAIFQVQKD